MVKTLLVVALAALALASVSASPRDLLQASYPSGLQVPSSCKTKYECTGSGDQLYTCNGTMWVGKGSDVKLTCPAPAGAGTYTYVDTIPTYTLACGSVQGDPKTQVRQTNPSNDPTDSTLYKRTAVSPAGCLSDVKYVLRSAAKGGLPADMSCSGVNTTARLPYTGTWDFVTC